MAAQGIDERGGIAATTAAGNGMSIRHDVDKAYAAYPPVEAACRHRANLARFKFPISLEYAAYPNEWRTHHEYRSDADASGLHDRTSLRHRVHRSLVTL
jgi:hypothetical protein